MTTTPLGSDSANLSKARGQERQREAERLAAYYHQQSLLEDRENASAANRGRSI